MLLQKDIIFISCDEYYLGPSGGGNDIFSDIYLLNLLGFKVKNFSIDKNGRVKNQDKNCFVDPTVLNISNSILFFSISLLQIIIFIFF